MVAVQRFWPQNFVKHNVCFARFVCQYARTSCNATKSTTALSNLIWHQMWISSKTRDAEALHLVSGYIYVLRESLEQPNILLTKEFALSWMQMNRSDIEPFLDANMQQEQTRVRVCTCLSDDCIWGGGQTCSRLFVRRPVRVPLKWFDTTGWLAYAHGLGESTSPFSTGGGGVHALYPPQGVMFSKLWSWGTSHQRCLCALLLVFHILHLLPGDVSELQHGWSARHFIWADFASRSRARCKGQQDSNREPAESALCLNICARCKGQQNSKREIASAVRLPLPTGRWLWLTTKIGLTLVGAGWIKLWTFWAVCHSFFWTGNQVEFNKNDSEIRRKLSISSKNFLRSRVKQLYFRKWRLDPLKNNLWESSACSSVKLFYKIVSNMSAELE